MIEFKKGLSGFFDSLVPAGLRERRDDGYGEYIRIRALSSMLVMMLLLSVPGAIFALIEQLPSTGFILAEWSGVIIFAVIGVQVLLFYRFNNYWLSALAFTSIYFLVVVILVVMSGGHQSPMKMLLLTCPFMSFMISGKHEGIQTSMLVVVIGITLAFLQSIDFEAPDIYSDANDYLIFVVDWIIAVIIIIFSIMVYESALKKDKKIRESSVTHRASEPVRGVADRLFHRLVPLALRDSFPVGDMAYIRARFLSVLLLVLSILGILTTLPMLAVFWWFDHDPSRMALQNLATISALLLFVLQWWMFYRFGNQKFSSRLFVNSYFLVIMAMIFSSGSYDSSLKFFLLTCPLIAFVVGGIREGIQNALFTTIAGVALAVFKMQGVEVQDVFTVGAHPYLVFGTNWMVTVGIIVACIAVYETELQRKMV